MTRQLSSYEQDSIDRFIFHSDHISLFILYEDTAIREHLITYLTTNYSYDVAYKYDEYIADEPENFYLDDNPDLSDSEDEYRLPPISEKQAFKISAVCAFKQSVEIHDIWFTEEDRDELCAGDLDVETFTYVLETQFIQSGEKYTIVNDVEGGCYCGRYRNLPPPNSTPAMEIDIDISSVAISQTCQNISNNVEDRVMEISIPSLESSVMGTVCVPTTPERPQSVGSEFDDLDRQSPEMCVIYTRQTNKQLVIKASHVDELRAVRSPVAPAKLQILSAAKTVNEVTEFEESTHHITVVRRKIPLSKALINVNIPEDVLPQIMERFPVEHSAIRRYQGEFRLQVTGSVAVKIQSHLYRLKSRYKE